jgi:hypothetical protein
MDFSAFDKQIDMKSLQAQVAEAEKNGGTGEYPEVPEGIYMCRLERLELGATSPAKGSRPMVRAMFRIIEGEYKKQCLFMNRTIYGTQNDANMIASAVGFLKKLEPSEDVGPVIFQSYNQFADLIDDIMEDVDGELEYEVEYDPDAFNSISIIDVYEV